jgi:CHAT domain-containing protein
MKTWLCTIFKLFCIWPILLAQTQDYKNELNTYKEKAEFFFYTNPSLSSEYYKKITRISILNEDWTEVFDAYFGLNDLALNSNNFEIIKFNLNLLDSLAARHKQFIDKSNDSLYFKNYINYQKGFYNYKIANHDSALDNFEKIIARTEKKPDSLLNSENKYEVISALSTIARIYADEGKYDISKSTYEKTIRFITLRYSQDKDLLFSIYNLYADLLQELNNYKKSNYYFLKTLPYHQEMRSKNSVITSTTNIIENYLSLNQLDSAKYYLQKLKTEISEENRFHNLYCIIASKFHEANNNSEEALNLLKINKELSLNKWEGKSQQVITESYDLIGKLYQRLNLPLEAVENFETALTFISKDTISSIINKTIQFKIIKDKIKSLNYLKKYKLTIEDSDKAISFLDSIKPSFKNNIDKLFLIEDAFSLFENSIEAAYNLFLKTSNPKYIDKAFFFSEKSKSTLLLESLLSTQANSFTKIPKDIIEKENSLKAKINYTEKAINKNSTLELQDQLFDLKQEYRQLVDTIESDYKQYYNLKYNTEVMTLSELQKKIDNNAIVLSYFYGNNAIYVISVSKNYKHIKKIELNSDLENLIRDYYSIISNPKSDLNELKKKSNRLYHKLVSKKTFKDDIEQVIIIPDGLLNYIPFESFNTDNSNYLVEEYSISYTNSATLLKQLKPNAKNNIKVMAFAPNFNKSNSSVLLELPNNIKETENILSHFKGTAFTNENASLINFNSHNKDYGIIHLATHAVLNDKNPEYSYLAFTPNFKDENLLYIADLYNLQLTANMITLSACESGIGDLKRGEGMMSLAHGFYFSGTKSIASTLWKVNDASSSSLMDVFYKNLSEGKTKNLALQNAKLDFITKNKNNALSHPYYWSGFIISGNINPLVDTNKWLYFGLVFLSFIILGLLLKKNRI